MTTYKRIEEHPARGGAVRVSCYREKFAAVDLWRVDFVYFRNGLGYARNVRRDLLTKPGKRQVQKYLEMF